MPLLQHICYKEKNLNNLNFLFVEPKNYFIFASAFSNGLVVQLVRISACHAGGRGFESRPDRKKPQHICNQIVEVLFFMKTFSFLYLTIHF